MGGAGRGGGGGLNRSCLLLPAQVQHPCDTPMSYESLTKELNCVFWMKNHETGMVLKGQWVATHMTSPPGITVMSPPGTGPGSECSHLHASQPPSPSPSMHHQAHAGAGHHECVLLFMGSPRIANLKEMQQLGGCGGLVAAIGV